MVREVVRKKRIARVYADAAYDSRRNFNLLRERGIEPAIKLKRGSSTMSLGSPLRRREAVLLKSVGYEGWKRLKDYGKRWKLIPQSFVLAKILVSMVEHLKSLMALSTSSARSG